MPSGFAKVRGGEASTSGAHADRARYHVSTRDAQLLRAGSACRLPVARPALHAHRLLSGGGVVFSPQENEKVRRER